MSAGWWNQKRIVCRASSYTSAHATGVSAAYIERKLYGSSIVMFAIANRVVPEAGART